MWLTSVCVSLYVYLSLTAAHNITFFSPHSTELSESAVVMEKTDGSNGMQHPRIIPIMLNWLWAGEQQQQQHKQNWTWHPQLVMNHNLIELLFMSMSVYTCICIYIRPVGTYTFTYICNGRYVIVCVLLTCCVIAKPMTGSPSGMSHVTTAEFAFTALMVTLTGGDKLSADTERERERNKKLVLSFAKWTKWEDQLLCVSAGAQILPPEWQEAKFSSVSKWLRWIHYERWKQW